MRAYPNLKQPIIQQKRQKKKKKKKKIANIFFPNRSPSAPPNSGGSHKKALISISLTPASNSFIRERCSSASPLPVDFFELDLRKNVSSEDHSDLPLSNACRILRSKGAQIAGNRGSGRFRRRRRMPSPFRQGWICDEVRVLDLRGYGEREVSVEESGVSGFSFRQEDLIREISYAFVISR